VPVVIVTGTGSEETGVEAMKLGAADYVIKTPKQHPAPAADRHGGAGKRRCRRKSERIDCSS
jgi:ActR/RegA family two-component response regulator